jgi:hypothetical protein
LTKGPKNPFESSHRCHFSDDLAKQPAATSTNGVVGTNGKNTPMAARPTNRNPNDL